ncbi:MAG: DUF2239 family protein [Aestuariivirga sp.]
MKDSAKLQESNPAKDFVCLSDSRKIAEGSLADVALTAWNFAKSHPSQPTLAFDRQTGAVVDLNLSGTSFDVAARYSAQTEIPKRGRPKLGVTAREVTLLPRHWDWLAQQPGGASVTLRRLVETARKETAPKLAARDRLAAAYKFMSAIGGDLPSFEEASRALFAQNFAKLETCLSKWPSDISAEVRSFLGDLMPSSELQPINPS